MPSPEWGGGAERSPAPSTRTRMGRHRRPSGRGRTVAAFGLAAVALIGVGTGIRELDRPPAVTAPDLGALPGPALTTAPTSTTPTGSPAPSRTTSARRTPKPAPKPAPTVPPAPPNGFALPAQHVTAPVLPIGVRRDGELDLPESPKTVGWWVGSAPAGSSTRQSTVLAGHVDSKAEGVGAFAALRDVQAGSQVLLSDSFRGQHTYRVVARRTYPKYALPRSVFTGAPLVLITCGGPFDEAHGRYRDNIVVYAEPA